MQNSPGIPLASLVVAIALVIVTAVSGMAGVGRDDALTELQIAASAFAVSFAVPAAALKALALEKPIMAVGDVFTYADATTGGQPGQPFKAADLPVNGSAQLFPMGKETNENNLVQVIRIAPGDG